MGSSVETTSLVAELIDGFPIDDTIRRVERNENLLLTKPPPGPMKFWRDYDLLRAVSLPTKYVASKFAPPLGVYESDHVRIEWQKMDFRQPFYHRNADVDEISYHVAGERTFMSEKGSVDLTVGDFLRIPVSVAHDNRGVEDVHLIFYIPTPVTECVPPTRTTEYRMPPFPGWEPKPNSAHVEMMTECLGAIECDVAVSLTDERMLLDTAQKDSERPINILREPSESSAGGASSSSSSGVGGPVWLYKSPNVWLGSTTTTPSNNNAPKGGDVVYRRHRRADEIQYQVHGRRTLVTQRGTIDLEPGDFVCIPLGTAFTDIVRDQESTSTHLTVLTRFPAPAKREYSKSAAETSPELVAQLRKRG